MALKDILARRDKTIFGKQYVVLSIPIKEARLMLRRLEKSEDIQPLWDRVRELLSVLVP